VKNVSANLRVFGSSAFRSLIFVTRSSNSNSVALSRCNKFMPKIKSKIIQTIFSGTRFDLFMTSLLVVKYFISLVPSYQCKSQNNFSWIRFRDHLSFHLSFLDEYLLFLAKVIRLHKQGSHRHSLHF